MLTRAREKAEGQRLLCHLLQQSWREELLMESSTVSLGRRRMARDARATIYFRPTTGHGSERHEAGRRRIANKKLEPRKVPALESWPSILEGVRQSGPQRLSAVPLAYLRCKSLIQDKTSARVAKHCASGWAEICGAAEGVGARVPDAQNPVVEERLAPSLRLETQLKRI